MRSTGDLPVRVCVCHCAALPRPVSSTNGKFSFGGSGIGLATVELLAGAGAAVALNHLPGDSAAAAAAQRLQADNLEVTPALGDVSKVEARASVQVAVDPTAPRNTSVALAAGTDDPVAGESVALIATVKPAGAAGKVEFVEGEQIVGSAEVTGGTATADVVIATSGAHTYIARFVPADEDAFATALVRKILG